MKILAAILTEPQQPFLIEQLDLEGPRQGEVLIQIKAAGVCHSDWHLVTGSTKHPMPVVAGHEGAGVVAEVGSGVSKLKAGDPVVLNWAPDCGECFYCRIGKPNLCDTWTGPIWAGVMLDGTPRLKFRGRPAYHYCGLAAFAEYAVVPEQSCVIMPKDVPFDIAALVGCAVSTGVGAVIHTAGVKKGESVAVIGCGGVGLSVVQGAMLAGASRIIAIDKSAGRLDFAQRLGATDAVLSANNVVTEVRKLTEGRGADHVFEAVGLPALQELGLELARPGGVLTLAGLSPMGTPTNLPGAVIVRQEKTVKGSYYGSVNARNDFPMLLDLHRQGKLQLDKLISSRWKLNQINEAYAAMLSGQGARGVITF